jgi:hypothetical protein
VEGVSSNVVGLIDPMVKKMCAWCNTYILLVFVHHRTSQIVKVYINH